MQAASLNHHVVEAYRADLDELQQATLPWIMLITGVLGIVWQLFHQHPAVIFVLLFSHAGAFALLSRRVRLAAAVWGLGVLLGLSLLVAASQQSVLLLFSILVPLSLTLVLGPLEGLAGEVAILLSGLALQRLGGDLPDLPSYLAATALLGGVAAAIGMVAKYSLFNMLRLYYENYRRATRDLDEAREERLEYQQVQEDLRHANRELGRLTAQLKLANEIAEEARRAKENFVATVSHELRTPLNMVIGFSEIIAQSPQVYGIRLPPMLLADISSIQRNSQHLLELINDVLDLSQVDMGNLSISRDWCSLQQMVAEAFDVIRPLFQSKKLFLEAQLPDEDVAVYCDQTRIREVIINLLSNAGRFTDRGGVVLRASVDAHALTVAVKDSGPGISAEDQKKLFEPFQQLDSTIRRQHDGSGLGLAISKRFVEMHGGKMHLESQVEKGTTVFFDLPLDTSQPEVAAGVSRWINPYALQEGRQRAFKARLDAPAPCFVVLEEDRVVQHILARYLDEIEVHPVRDVETVIAELEQSTCHLLIINHPQAAELYRALTARYHLPLGLSVMTFFLPSKSDAADTLGIHSYLVKPVSAEVLLTTLADIGQGVKTVLLVDDNPEVLQLFGRILSSAKAGYRVLRASDGAQGLAMLRKRRPDVMILDLVMPEMDGMQVLAEKAADPVIRDIPTVVITAQDPAGMPKISAEVMLAREGGFSPKDLLELVRSVGYPPKAAG